MDANSSEGVILMDLKEARKMYPGFPKTGAPGDVTVKKIRKQQRMIKHRQKKGLA